MRTLVLERNRGEVLAAEDREHDGRILVPLQERGEMPVYVERERDGDEEIHEERDDDEEDETRHHVEADLGRILVAGLQTAAEHLVQGEHRFREYEQEEQDGIDDEEGILVERHHAEYLEFREGGRADAEDERYGDDAYAADGVEEPPEVGPLDGEVLLADVVDGVAELDPCGSLDAECNLCPEPDFRASEKEVSDKASRVPVDADEQQLVECLGELLDADLLPHHVGDQEG